MNGLIVIAKCRISEICGKEQYELRHRSQLQLQLTEDGRILITGYNNKKSDFLISPHRLTPIPSH